VIANRRGRPGLVPASLQRKKKGETMRGKFVFAGLMALLAGPASMAQGQPPGRGSFPVIVVFADDMRLDGFRGDFRADERARANPQAWNYLDRGVAGAVQSLESVHGFRAEHVFGAALNGFAARLSARQIADLENDPLVAYVEADGIATTQAQGLPWGINRIDADVSSTVAGNGSGAVSNVRAYIIDTGIATHDDLNQVGHVNFTGDGINQDCHGHGTHVAGTVAARDNAADVVGAAPGAPVIGVKVLGCNGSGALSGVIKGVDWVTANAVKPAVANMSLSSGATLALDAAVKKSADSGVFYAVSAGNSGADACNYSPARAGTHPGVMTTAATNSYNIEASWSNYGRCVDVWAPGVGILSTKRGGGTTTMSGTSMASPHVAGAGALYLSTHTGTAAAVETALTTAAYDNKPGTLSKDKTLIELLSAGGF
jgi:subtilisin family serine protease